MDFMLTFFPILVVAIVVCVVGLFLAPPVLYLFEKWDRLVRGKLRGHNRRMGRYGRF